jgi:1,4-alpha-glucan branching enzyme
MNSFDRAMQHLDKAFGFVSAPHSWVSRKDEADKIIVVERGEPTNQPACFAAAKK